MCDRLSQDEYASLSDQKADDWRSISEVNPTLFGVAGAIFAAGVAESQPEVVALSPVPLYLGVWHMVRHARLQLQMITYLDVFAPAEISWERDIAVVRPKFWEQSRGAHRKWVAELMRPSAWNTWLGITAAISTVAILIPWLADYPNWCRAIWVGLPVSLAASVAVFWQSRKIQPDRERWTRLWEEHKRDRESQRNA
jgi:hypothetical protein